MEKSHVNGPAPAPGMSQVKAPCYESDKIAWMHAANLKLIRFEDWANKVLNEAEQQIRAKHPKKRK